MTVQNKILTHCFDSFMKYGVRSVSMDDIAKSIGISKKTIYIHFDKKEELVEKTVTHFVSKDQNDIKEIVNQSINAVDALVSVAQHVLKMLRRMSSSVIFDLKKYYPELWSIIDAKHHKFIFTIIKNNIQKGIKEGFYRQDINADIVARFYVSLTHTVVDQETFSLENYERTQLYKELIKYHLNSILSPSGKEYLVKQEII